MSWTSIHGDWQELEGVLTQSNVNGITRYANDLGYANYIVQFKFRMTNTTPQYDGEVKFIITDADEINEWVRDSDVIIADITNRNPNVFYELGLAHALKRKAILLIQREEGKDLDIPFDISDFRCHPYEYSSAGFEKLRERLLTLLNNVMAKEQH